MQVVYEDNHIIIVYKESGEIVQGDKTGDTPLSDLVKDYIKEKYRKPGNVFLGVVHRLDRPVAGLVVFAKTSKALSRLNDMFRNGEVHKTYWAIVSLPPTPSMRKGSDGQVAYDDEWHELTHWLVRNEQQNKSYAYDSPAPLSHGNVKGRAVSLSSKALLQAKKAVLKYRVISKSERYYLLEVNLMTGRHHQIRCQLAHIGSPIKGDLKYGAKRSNPDGSISLLARKIAFTHPVSKKPICVESPLPSGTLFEKLRQVAF